MSEPFDLTTTPVHLGLGATAEPIHGFTWESPGFDEYLARVQSDGDEGRMVTMFSFSEPWEAWEMHPHGSELVICVSGSARVHQELDGTTTVVDLQPGQAIVNQPGTWHIADVDEPTTMVFITSGRGTEHRPR